MVGRAWQAFRRGREDFGKKLALSLPSNGKPTLECEQGCPVNTKGSSHCIRTRGSPSAQLDGNVAHEWEAPKAFKQGSPWWLLLLLVGLYKYSMKVKVQDKMKELTAPAVGELKVQRKEKECSCWSECRDHYCSVEIKGRREKEKELLWE